MTDNTATCFNVVLALSSLFPAAAVGGGLFFDILSRGAATVALAALTAAALAAEMIVLPAVAVAGAGAGAVALAAVTLVSNATATLMHGRQSAANGGPDGDNDSAEATMQ